MKRAMALATRVECDEVSDGFGGKCDGNEGGRRLMVTRAMTMVTVTMWLMVTVTRLAGEEEGKGEGGKGDGDGDEGGGHQRGNVNGGKSNGNGDNGGRRAMVMATKRVMVTATKVGEVGRRRNGQWRWRDSNKENFAIWSKMVRLDPTMMVSTRPKWHRPRSWC
jgi:hypothetical protein